MMNKKWKVAYLPEAEASLQKMDGSQKKLISKEIEKVQINPLSKAEGGYGEPLGSKKGCNLSKLLKIKLRKCGLRVVYLAQKEKHTMLIINIGVRKDHIIYNEAEQIVREHHLFT